VVEASGRGASVGRDSIGGASVGKLQSVVFS
jgi:hypothetical protein